jgi:hypothetical protein
VELGVLQEITGYQRNRRYRYEPYLALFESPQSAEPAEAVPPAGTKTEA